MIFHPRDREKLGRCHHCEHHPTQGHAPSCPTRATWRGSGTHTPLDWPPDLTPTQHTANTNKPQPSDDCDGDGDVELTLI